MDVAAGQPLPYPPEGPRTVAGQRIDWGPRDVGIGIAWFIGLFIVAPIIIATPIAFAAGTESDVYYGSALVLAAASEAGIAAVAAWLTFGRHGGGWERLGLRPPGRRAFAWAGIAVVAALAFSLAYAGVVELLDADALRPSCDDQLPKQVLNNGALLAIAGVVIVAFAPVCEEMFFRGFAFPGLASRWGLWAGIVLSGLLFSVAHVGPSMHKTFVPILGIGIVFAFSYARSGNLLSTMLAHLAFNVLSFTQLALESCK